MKYFQKCIFIFEVLLFIQSHAREYARPLYRTLVTASSSQLIEIYTLVVKKTAQIALQQPSITLRKQSDIRIHTLAHFSSSLIYICVTVIVSQVYCKDIVLLKVYVYASYHEVL